MPFIDQDGWLDLPIKSEANVRRFDGFPTQRHEVYIILLMRQTGVAGWASFAAAALRFSLRVFPALDDGAAADPVAYIECEPSAAPCGANDVQFRRGSLLA